jgi:hypothetical protein
MNSDAESINHQLISTINHIVPFRRRTLAGVKTLGQD